MSDTTGSARGDAPRYQIKAFANPESAQKWLAEMTREGYRFLAMDNQVATNHFSKELEGLIWILLERDK